MPVIATVGIYADGICTGLDQLLQYVDAFRLILLLPILDSDQLPLLEYQAALLPDHALPPIMPQNFQICRFL